MKKEWTMTALLPDIAQWLRGRTEKYAPKGSRQTTRTFEILYNGQKTHSAFWFPEDDLDQWLAGGGERRSMPPLILPGR